MSWGASRYVANHFTLPPLHGPSIFGSVNCGSPVVRQSMLGDGRVVTWTDGQLEEYHQQGRVNAVATDWSLHADDPVGGILYGVAQKAGLSPVTQIAFHDLGVAANGMAIGIGGIQGAVIPGSNNQTSFAVEANLQLRYKPGWTADQRSAADLKVRALDASDILVSKSKRSGFSASSTYSREYGSVPSGYDVDHLRDLQLGGSDALNNMWFLNSSVNRSLGAQIQNQIWGLPPGTKINRVTIRD